MPEPLIILSLGFLLGLKHATDADHIAAVSSILVRTLKLKSAVKIGAFWGMGHTLILLLAGGTVLILKLSIPERLLLGAEFVVGIALILIAIMVLKDLPKARHFPLKIHRHFHVHGEGKHIHIHSHLLEEHRLEHQHRHGIKAFGFGLLHGLAGSGALTLLVLSTINSPVLGLVYILIFGSGSILGMMLLSGLIGLPIKLGAQKGSRRLILGINVLAALFSLIVGVLLIAETIPALS